jgi:very-short-patch-repair endonuclease
VRVIDHPFRGSDAVDAGLLTRAALQSSRYAAVFRDVFVPADLRQDLVLRSRAAYLLVPPDGALGGHSAAALLGAGFSPENARAEIIAPRGDVRPRRGLVVRQHQLDPADVCDVDGCRVTTPIRTAWDLGRRSSLAEAVVAIDALARVGGFAPVRLLDGPPGARGRRHLARAVGLADPRAESPPETHLRLVLVLGGLPVPEVQFRIRDGRGEVVARADLAYPAAMLAAEYDGSDHFDDARSRSDRARDLLLGDLGWLTLRFTRDDIVRHPERTVAIVRRRLAERSSRTTLR